LSYTDLIPALEAQAKPETNPRYNGDGNRPDTHKNRILNQSAKARNRITPDLIATWLASAIPAQSTLRPIPVSSIKSLTCVVVFKTKKAGNIRPAFLLLNACFDAVANQNSDLPH